MYQLSCIERETHAFPHHLTHFRNISRISITSHPIFEQFSHKILISEWGFCLRLLGNFNLVGSSTCWKKKESRKACRNCSSLLYWMWCCPIFPVNWWKVEISNNAFIWVGLKGRIANWPIGLGYGVHLF